MRRAVLALIALAAIESVPAAVQQPAFDGLTTARIDVVVTDSRGRPVDNLKADDFEIWEDGQRRRIDNLRFVNTRGEAGSSTTLTPIVSRLDESAEAARDGTRLFAVFLDEYHASPGEGVDRARQLLSALVAQLAPRDLVAIVKPLDSLVDLKLDRDRQKTLDEIASFVGRKGDYAARNNFEANYIAANPARIDAVRTQIVTSALNALAVHLGSLNTGRKSIIVVSEGFAAPPRRRGDEPLPTLEGVIRSANRGHVSIYAIDPLAFVDKPPSVEASADSSSDQQPGTRANLRVLAEQTQGTAVLAAAAAREWVTGVMNDASAYYLIDFRPAHGDDIGMFHAVDVRVRRSDLKVRARSGYWTPTVDDLLRARMALKAAEPKPPPEPALHASPLIRPWFGMSRGTDGNLRIRFVWEPTARVPGDRARSGPPSQVGMTVVKDGATVFEGNVRPSAGSSGEASADASPDAVFDVTAGRMRVQMTIQDEANRVLDRDIRDVTVGSLAGQVALGTAQVLRARNAREFRQLESDADAVPVAGRDFSRTERLLIRVPAYAADGTPAMSARLLGRSGSILRELPVVPSPATDMYDVDLPLAGLANGNYTLEVAVASGSAQAKQAVPFRITP